MSNTHWFFFLSWPKKGFLVKFFLIFFRSGNIYHCIICGNKRIGREKHQAMEHLSMSHAKEEMAMKEFITQKYDEHVDKNFGKFLRHVLHKVDVLFQKKKSFWMADHWMDYVPKLWNIFQSTREFLLLKPRQYIRHADQIFLPEPWPGLIYEAYKNT